MDIWIRSMIGTQRGAFASAYLSAHVRGYISLVKIYIKWCWVSRAMISAADCLQF